MRTCMCEHARADVCVLVVSVCMFAGACMYFCVCVCVFVYLCVCVCVCVFVCVCMRACARVVHTYRLPGF